MGPYGLSRLVRETGGVYFQTTLTTSAAFSPTGIFNPADVKPFAPDYHFSTPQEYIRDVGRHPLRAAVMRAAELSRKGKVQGTPPLEMRVAPGNYLARLTEMQKPLAESAYAIDEMLAGFTPAVEREYAKETQPRWQVNYDLSLGRLLAMKVRVSEFNIACAQLKQLGAGEVEQKTNHWIFRPSAEQFAGGAASRRMARESERLLKRVVETAPGTPWAVWAQRELSQPLGVEVLHRFDPPPKPAEQRPAPPAAPATPGKKQVQLANDPMKRPPPARPTPPPPPPKLPKL
ncbi:MAG: hypothetical protein NT069_18250 [Planctomycetota bacterium]|nr:hypothetical protein [Planctomycetota bacterium]